MVQHATISVDDERESRREGRVSDLELAHALITLERVERDRPALDDEIAGAFEDAIAAGAGVGLTHPRECSR